MTSPATPSRWLCTAPDWALAQARELSYWKRALACGAPPAPTWAAADVPQPIESILEVGPGPSSPIAEVPAARRVVVEPLANAYARAGYPINETFAGCTVVPHPLESAGIAGPFDAVVCANALDHMRDARSALRAMIALLAPGGTLLLVVDTRPGPSTSDTHPLSIPHEELLAALRSAGEVASDTIAGPGCSGADARRRIVLRKRA